MSSRLKLQKDTAARKKAEQQVLQGCQSVTPLFIYQRLPNLQALLEKQRSEHELFDSLKGTNPGTAGRLYGGMLTRQHEHTKNVLISDSDSEGTSDDSASAASDSFSAEESQQSSSQASSIDDDGEDSPPPAKRGKKSATSTARVSERKTQVQATASRSRAASKAATSKPAAAKKASSTVKSGTKQQAARTSAKKRSSSSPEVQETLPMKARPAAGTTAAAKDGSVAAEAAQLATVASTIESADQPAITVMPPQDDHKPSTIAAAPKAPAVTQPKAAAPKDQKVLPGSTLPKHMTKGIQINSPGPAYRAPGLRRPQGGKPLHQIQPRTH
ncbi:hypothetical protein ABBQ38_001115 [Trebouxia sp. C0009 RCD-2024]